MEPSYWPWWAGALALAAIAWSYWQFEHRGFGVSGSVRRVLRRFGSARKKEAQREQLEAGTDAELMALLEAATREAMLAKGLQAADSKLEPADNDQDPSQGLAKLLPQPAQLSVPVPQKATTVTTQALGAPAPATAHAVLLLGIISGAAIAAFFDGSWGRTGVDPALAALLGSTSLGVLASMLGGGLLIGFGASMSGGCTAGHGLSGVPMLAPGSLLATPCFFGMAIALSFLFSWL